MVSVFLVLVAVAVTVAVLLTSGSSCADLKTISGNHGLSASYLNTPSSHFKVAFFGDQGLYDGSESVLELVKSEGATMIVHLGDLDYEDDPASWDAMITKHLSDSFPYLVVIGNHDTTKWTTSNGYQDVLERRYKASGLADACSGTIGVDFVCGFNGVLFVLPGIGTFCDDTAHEQFVSDSLQKYKTLYSWRVCGWHKLMRLMQVGGKDDETGWAVYETCRENGAIVASGHEHSYSRSYLMSSFQNQQMASTANPVQLSDGNSFAFVNGLGGIEIRVQDPQLAANPYWAKVYTSDQNANYGAVFCDFHQNSTSCYFKSIDNNIIDSWTVLPPPMS